MSVLNLWERCLLASNTTCRKSPWYKCRIFTNCTWLTINSSTQTV